MSDLSEKLLELINKELTINEICSILNLSHKQVYNILRGLKTIGMEFNKKYYSDGETIYIPKKDLSWMTKKNNVNIITPNDEDTFSAMVISDLHFGNMLENVDAINKIYDYCIKKNIHIIINAGDFIDGISIGKIEEKKHKDDLEQIEYAIKNYPFDKNILNFMVLGNHDVAPLLSKGIDFATYLRNFRQDIVPLGYGHGRINIKNDKIIVNHPLGLGNSVEHELPNSYILIKGHHHVSKSFIGTNGNCSFCAPTLSNLFISEDTFLPGAVVLTTKFKNGYFETVYIENLLINDYVNVVNVTQYNVNPLRDKNSDESIKYEEDFSKRKTLKK